MEPTYVYVKGKGWIPEIIPSIEAVMKDGTRVRIESRNPNYGEYFLRSMSWLGGDGMPVLADFKYCIEKYYQDFEELVSSRTFDADKEYILSTPEYALVTVVLL